MKFISISLVKNEADIIELFIRINSRVIDHFFIVDNGSTDHTIKIINKLKDEGYNITLYLDPTTAYVQDKMTTRALRTAASTEKFDWAFILDADEFINIPKEELEKELSTIKEENTVAALRWSNWIPKGDIYYDYPNPLWSCFERKAEEEVDFVKIVVPYNLSQKIMTSLGNHYALLVKDLETVDLSFAQRLETVTLECGVLDHVPVRSSGQILTKTIIGEIALSMKKLRNPHEGYHWRHNYKIIKEYNFEVDDSLLRYLGVNYLSDKGNFTDEVHPTDRLGLETDVVKYRVLYRFNYRGRIFNYMQQLAETVRGSK